MSFKDVSNTSAFSLPLRILSLKREQSLCLSELDNTKRA